MNRGLTLKCVQCDSHAFHIRYEMGPPPGGVPRPRPSGSDECVQYGHVADATAQGAMLANIQPAREADAQGAKDDPRALSQRATLDRSLRMGHAAIGPREPHEQGDFPMATYHTIRGQILARVPGIDPADIPRVLQMLVSTARGPEWPDLAQVTHALAGLETLWVEEILDHQEAIAAQQQDGLTHGLTEAETEAKVMASLRQDFMRAEPPQRLW
jgi:hypothetical protein